MFGYENSIEPVKASQSRKAQDEDMPIREATRHEAARLKPTTFSSEPDAVAKQHNFYTANKQSTRIYYTDYQQKSEVMRAEPAKITTKLDDRQTVSAMLDLAQSRGWETIKLRGSEDFKHEAWVQANVRGIETTGYKPTEADVQEADKRKLAAQPVKVPELLQKTRTIKVAPGHMKARADLSAALKRETESPKPTVQRPAQAVWGAVEVAGKQAREHDPVKPVEKTVEKAAA